MIAQYEVGRAEDREGNHWDVLRSLAQSEEGVREFLENAKDSMYFELGVEPEEIVFNSIILSIDWLRIRYIELTSCGQYPENYTYVVDLSQEEATNILEGVDEEAQEYFLESVDEIYSYNGLGFFEKDIYESFKFGKQGDCIESLIAECLIQEVIEEGWFLIWEYSGDIMIANNPYQQIW